MEIAEQREVALVQPVGGLDRLVEVVAAGPGPCGEQDGGDVAPARVAAAREMGAGGRELTLLEGAHAKRQLGEAVLGIGAHEPFGQREGLRHFAIGERGDEGALQQDGVARIGAERLAEIGGGRAGVLPGAGDEGGEVIARLRAADLDGRLAERRVARNAGGGREQRQCGGGEHGRAPDAPAPPAGLRKQQA